MKIKIVRSVLLDGLKKVQAASNAKNAMIILGNVKVEAKDDHIALTATDLDITLYAEVNCMVEEPGETTIPVRQLMAYVACLNEGELTMETDGTGVKVLCDRSRAKIVTLPADQFPKMQLSDIKRSFTIKGEVFADMLKKTAYAQSDDETRRALMSVLIEAGNGHIRSVATDGRRLAVAENKADIDGGVETIILPSRSVSVVQKFAESADEIEVKIYANQVFFSANGGALKMCSQIVDSAYPNYNQVIPNFDMNEVFIDRDLLLSAIGRASAMDTTKASSVKLSVYDNRLGVEVKCENMCDSNDEVPIKYEGERVVALFNPKYIIDPLRACTTDNMIFKFSNGKSPVVLKSESGDFFCVLMPMRQN